MAAEIIQLKKTHKSVRSIDLYFCWDPRLNNPLLNKLYKEQVCYVERWYTEIIHLLNTEQVDHPLLLLALNRQDNTLNLLLEATEKDLYVQKKFGDYSTAYSVSHNIRKLNRWREKWTGLIKYRQIHEWS